MYADVMTDKKWRNLAVSGPGLDWFAGTGALLLLDLLLQIFINIRALF